MNSSGFDVRVELFAKDRDDRPNVATRNAARENILGYAQHHSKPIGEITEKFIEVSGKNFPTKLMWVMGANFIKNDAKAA